MQDAFPPRRDVAAALVAWGNAWLGGHVGLDEAVDAIEDATTPQIVGGLADDPGDLPLRRGLAVLRVAGMTTLRLALPAPGDPLGLTGPPAFNAAAVDAGEAVLVAMPDAAIGLVPEEDRRGSSYVGVRWHVHEARPGVADVPSLAEADHRLTLAMRAATEALLTVDGAAGVPPEIADALADLRDPERGATLAPGYPARAHRVAALAGRLALVVDLARRLEGHGLTADQMRRREEALRMLDRAVRRARVAAHNSAFDPVP
ncbi:MAG TPA: hypothetical protein VHJ17_07070 [Thermomonospora sp.]|nr:hypothetical protein [Thermomonospora sp.]